MRCLWGTISFPYPWNGRLIATYYEITNDDSPNLVFHGFFFSTFVRTELTLDGATSCTIVIDDSSFEY